MTLRIEDPDLTILRPNAAPEKPELTALDQMGYNGFLSLEPHLANFAGLGSLENDAAVRVENDTEKAFCVAYRALEKILTGK